MSKVQNKRKTLNILMVAAILVILIAGIMTVGNLQGWFDKGETILATQADGTVTTVATAAMTAQNKIGSANIERHGVAYSLTDGTRLRDGDIVETLNGSSIDIVFGSNTISLDENSQAVVGVAEDNSYLTLSGGGLFANISERFTLKLMDTDVTVENGVFSASAPYGSASIYVYENVVTVGGSDVKAGNAASILSDGVHTAALSIQSLNRFDLERVTKTNEIKALCFTKSDIQQLNQEREESKKIAEDAERLEEENEQAIAEQRKENENNQVDDRTDGGTGDGGDTGDGGTGGGGTDDASPKCTITIRCDTILNNTGDLAEGKNKYVPADGCILATSTLSFSEGDTVFDVLKKACSLAKIQLEYSWTPMYNSYYIEGINNLYEFDCGNESGWMYKVNGWFPNYGCSAYTLEDGDVIVWCYTCKGLGADVGGSVY